MAANCKIRKLFPTLATKANCFLYPILLSGGGQGEGKWETSVVVSAIKKKKIHPKQKISFMIKVDIILLRDLFSLFNRIYPPFFPFCKFLLFH